MLKTILTAALIVANLSTPALAGTKTVSDTVYCGAIGDLAEAIMLKRQAGMTMSAMMRWVSPGDIEEMTKDFIRIAFDTPRFDTAEYQANAVLDFRNEAERACFKARR